MYAGVCRYLFSVADGCTVFVQVTSCVFRTLTVTVYIRFVDVYTVVCMCRNCFEGIASQQFNFSTVLFSFASQTAIRLGI